MPQKYIQYRFDQVNDLIVEEIKKPVRSLNSFLFRIIREHHEIRGIVYKNGLLMNIIMLIIYYGFTPFLNVMIYQVINVADDSIMNLAQRILSPFYAFCLYQFAYCSACLYKSFISH